MILKCIAGVLVGASLLAGCLDVADDKFGLIEKRREMYKSGTELPLWIRDGSWIDDRLKREQKNVYLGIVFYGRYNFSIDSSDRRFVDEEEARKLLRTYRWINEDKLVYQDE